MLPSQCRSPRKIAACAFSCPVAMAAKCGRSIFTTASAALRLRSTSTRPSLTRTCQRSMSVPSVMSKRRLADWPWKVGK